MKTLKSVVIVALLVVGFVAVMFFRAKVDLDAENGICTYCRAKTEQYDTTFISGTQYDKYICENGHDIMVLH